MSKNRIIYIILGLIFCLGLCSLNAYSINTNQLKLRQEEIKSDKFDESLNGKLIAYFTDLKYGTFINDEMLNKLDKKLSDFNPDIIIFGGDLIDGNLDHEKEESLLNFLTNLKAPYGKYAILGDEDNNDYLNDLYQKSNFNILNNTNEKIYIDSKKYFNLIGIDTKNKDIDAAYNNINILDFNLVVTHYPDSFNDLPLEKTDYVLAGHSLGGQVYIPLINLFTRQEGYNSYIKGKHVKNNTTLDISNGIGYENKKVRFLADSELVLYKLTYQP